MPSDDKMQKQEQALNGGSLSCEWKNIKQLEKLSVIIDSNKWARDGFTGADSTRSLFPAKWSYPKSCQKDTGKMSNR